jgi:hypothetical protein
MTEFPTELLDAIDRTEEIEVITLRADGTPRRPVPIWVVRVGDAVYVRSYRGEAGAWYRHARADGTGRVRVSGIEHAVEFELAADPATAEAVDAAYTRKYASYGQSYLKPMLAQAAQAATLQLTPHQN